MSNVEKSKIIRMTYIKKGIEKKVIVSPEIALEEKEVLEFSANKEKISIRKDIEWLHLNGLSFHDITEIECQNPETVLILEQCEFRRTTTFRKGNIVFYFPQFINPTGEYLPYNLLCCKNQSVEFILNEQYSYANNIYQVEAVENIKITGNAYNLIITEPNSTNSKLQTLHLKEVNHYYAGVLDAQNVIIENSKVDSLTNLKYKKLKIKNSTIASTNSNNVLDLNRGEVQIENTLLKGKTIILPDGIHKPNSGTLMYFGKLDRENLLAARFNLVSCLKQRKEQNDSKPTPLDCRQLKQPYQAVFSSVLKKEIHHIPNVQSEEDYFKNQIAIERRMRIKKC